MTGNQASDQPREAPELPGPADPPAGDPKTPEDAKALYGAKLGAWLERWKAQVAAEVTATALAATREDTARALKHAREDTALALTNSRETTQLAVGNARIDADRTAEAALLKSVHDAYIATTQSSLDRALTRVNVLTGAITAVTTIYTGLLALVFSAKTGEGNALTLAAIIPALFLGVALLLATIYASLLRKSQSMALLLPTGLGGQIDELRLSTFMTWCMKGVWDRAWALHASIVSLGLGVAALPIPFVALAGWQQNLIFWAGLVTVGLTALLSWQAAQD